MTKSTAASVEKNLNSALSNYKKEAGAVKDAHRTALAGIKNNTKLNDLGKQELIDELNASTKAKLSGLKDQQDSYIKTLTSKIESEFRGSQPTDANSILLRRDAADRARKISDKDEARAVLEDALSNGDDSLAHAVGQRARNSQWLEVAETYQAAHPSTADSAAALAHVEGLSGDPAFNFSNNMTFAPPLV